MLTSYESHWMLHLQPSAEQSRRTACARTCLGSTSHARGPWRAREAPDSLLAHRPRSGPWHAHCPFPPSPMYVHQQHNRKSSTQAINQPNGCIPKTRSRVAMTQGTGSTVAGDGQGCSQIEPRGSIYLCWVRGQVVGC